jgi:hypothetical protein
MLPRERRHSQSPFSEYNAVRMETTNQIHLPLTRHHETCPRLKGPQQARLSQFIRLTKASQLLRSNFYRVLNDHYPRRRPSDLLRGFSFCPRAHIPAQDYPAVVDLDADSPSIQLGAALDCCFNIVLDRVRLYLGLYFDIVDDALHT